MKTIIAGSRSITDSTHLHEAMKLVGWVITEVVCGCARGPDMLGAQWAEASDIPVRAMPADWDKHGKSAGFIRNREMAKYGDALIALWDKKSKGTRNMIDEALNEGLPVFIYRC